MGVPVSSSHLQGKASGGIARLLQVSPSLFQTIPCMISDLPQWCFQRHYRLFQS